LKFKKPQKKLRQAATARAFKSRRLRVNKFSHWYDCSALLSYCGKVANGIKVQDTYCKCLRFNPVCSSMLAFFFEAEDI
jgi:hypothetical protein